MSYQDKARVLVFEYIKPRLEKTDKHVTFAIDEVYVVWFSKTLQNWKCLISTTLPDGMYYEVTYNGDKAEAYIDAYKKFDNVVVPDELVTVTKAEYKKGSPEALAIETMITQGMIDQSSWVSNWTPESPK